MHKSFQYLIQVAENLAGSVPTKFAEKILPTVNWRAHQEKGQITKENIEQALDSYIGHTQAVATLKQLLEKSKEIHNA